MIVVRRLGFCMSLALLVTSAPVSMAHAAPAQGVVAADVSDYRRCRGLVRRDMPGRKAGRHLQSLRIAAVQRCVMTGAF